MLPRDLMGLPLDGGSQPPWGWGLLLTRGWSPAGSGWAVDLGCLPRAPRASRGEVGVEAVPVERAKPLGSGAVQNARLPSCLCTVPLSARRVCSDTPNWQPGLGGSSPPGRDMEEKMEKVCPATSSPELSAETTRNRLC